MKNWNDIKDGYGFKKIPSNLRKQFSCQICHDNSNRGDLYTKEKIHCDNTSKGYQKMIDKLIHNCWCKSHAIYYHKD